MAIDTRKLRYTLTSTTASLSCTVVSFEGVEAVNSLYEYKIKLSANSSLDFTNIVKQNFCFTISDSVNKRPIYGLAASLAMLGKVGTASMYELCLTPRLVQLRQKVTSRVYLGQTTQETVTKVLELHNFDSNDFEFDLNNTSYPTYDYRCQFNESDWSFISRILENEGVYFYFKQTGSQEKIVFTDYNQSSTSTSFDMNYQSLAGGTANYYTDKVFQFLGKQQLVSQTVRLRTENYTVSPSLVEGLAPNSLGADASTDVFLYNENFQDSASGNVLAKARQQELLAQKTVFNGKSGNYQFQSGCALKLSQHFRSDFNQKYMVTSIKHSGTADTKVLAQIKMVATTYQNDFTAIAEDIKFSPKRTTPKPYFHGQITAKIDAEQSGEYAELDNLGRYKVILPFDRSQPTAGKASHWVPMAQVLGGTNAGMHFPLRKGTEVLLSFIGGDVDQPFISATLPTKDEPSPVNSTNVTESVLKTSHGNQIRFQDNINKRSIELNTVEANTSLVLGKKIATADSNSSGVTMQSEGIHRVEVLGGQQHSLVAKDYKVNGKAIVATKEDPKKATHFINEQTDLYQFGLKNNTTGKELRKMTAKDELAGTQLVERKAGDIYVWHAGNKYVYGTDKEYEFGNDDTEVHANENGIDAGETWDVPASLKGAIKYTPADNLVEKVWGDSISFMNGQAYAWSETGNNMVYSFGNGYTENLIASGAELNKTWPFETLLPGASLDQSKYAAHNGSTFGGIYSGNINRKINIDAPNSAVEKTIGNAYSYTKGDSLSITVGNSESETYGSSWSYTVGNSDDSVIGNSKAVVTGNSEEEVRGNAKSLVVGSSAGMTVGNVSEMFFGVTQSLYSGAASENFLGAKSSMTVAASLEMCLAAAIEIVGGMKIEKSVASIDWSGCTIEKKLSKISSGAVSIGQSVIKIFA